MDQIRRNFTLHAVLWRYPNGGQMLPSGGWRLQIGSPDFSSPYETTYHREYGEAIKAIEDKGQPIYVELPDYSSDIILNQETPK